MADEHLHTANTDTPAFDHPESPLPQPDPDWLDQARNVSHEAPHSTGFRARPGQDRDDSRSALPRRAALTSRTMLRGVTGASLAGILVLAYIHFDGSPSAAADMLGSELIKLVPESAPIPGRQGPIDPRLADPVSLDLQLLAPRSEPAAALPQLADAAEHTDGLAVPQTREQTPGVLAPQASLPVREAAVNVPVYTPAPAIVATAPVTGTAMSNEELMLRLERLELLLAQLQAQRQTPAAQQVSAAAVKPAQAVAVAAPAAKATTRASRPAAPRVKKSEVAKPVQPAPPALGGQLVSVDMWNGEPSVVLASGLPGDRRVRVLRPGDVINGLALRSADPVTRSATFAAPGSQGMTLYVNQGG